MKKISEQSKNVTRHISSGGFIFMKDKETSVVWTLLITTKNNVVWICKGHIEKDEDYISAALREFEEELGLEKKFLTHIGLLKKIKYSYLENNSENIKEVYVNVFASKEKIDLSKNIGIEDIVKIDWYTIDDATDLITYDKEDLLDAQKIFLEYLKLI